MGDPASWRFRVGEGALTSKAPGSRRLNGFRGRRCAAGTQSKERRLWFAPVAPASGAIAGAISHALRVVRRRDCPSRLVRPSVATVSMLTTILGWVGWALLSPRLPPLRWATRPRSAFAGWLRNCPGDPRPRLSFRTTGSGRWRRCVAGHHSAIPRSRPRGGLPTGLGAAWWQTFGWVPR